MCPIKFKVKKKVPRYLIPMAGSAGKSVMMHIQDIKLPPGEKIILYIQAVDSAGNIGKETKTEVRTAPVKKITLLNQAFDSATISQNKSVSHGGDPDIIIIDLLDKVIPLSRKMIPSVSKGYQDKNHLFNLFEKK